MMNARVLLTCAAGHGFGDQLSNILNECGTY